MPPPHQETQVCPPFTTANILFHLIYEPKNLNILTLEANFEWIDTMKVVDVFIVAKESSQKRAALAIQLLGNYTIEEVQSP